MPAGPLARLPPAGRCAHGVGCAVAAFPLAPAAARAEAVASAASVFSGVRPSDLGRCAIPREQSGHRAHGLVDVVEEVLEAGAEVVESRLAVGRRGEAVFRAAAVACEAHVTLAALARERGTLVLAERALAI